MDGAEALVKDDVNSLMTSLADSRPTFTGFFAKATSSTLGITRFMVKSDENGIVSADPDCNQRRDGSSGRENAPSMMNS